MATVACAFPTSVSAQSRPRPSYEQSSKLWKWTSERAHHDSVVKVSVGESMGSGVIIFVDKNVQEGGGFLGYCATAQHVIDQAENRDNIQIEYQNGIVAADCQVVSENKEMDVAVVWVWIPKGIKAAKLATKKIDRGDPVEFVGLGGRFDFEQGLRHFVGYASAPTGMRKIYADQTLLPGDSGGPIFNRRRELVDIISGGWFWWGDKDIPTDNGNEFRATWPARGSNVLPLAALISRLPSCDIGKNIEPGDELIVAKRPKRSMPRTVRPDEPYIVYELSLIHI